MCRHTADKRLPNDNKRFPYMTDRSKTCLCDYVAGLNTEVKINVVCSQKEAERENKTMKAHSFFSAENSQTNHMVKLK